MILAAGRGERMRPLSDQRPKPLLSAGGKPLLQWLVESLSNDGFTELVVNTAWLGGQIESWLGDGHRFDVQIQYSREPSGALGTGGGIFNALPLLGKQAFIVVNGDIWTNYSFAHLHKHKDTQAHLVLVDNPTQHPDGDFELTQSLIGNGTNRRFTFAGIAVYHPDFFSSCGTGEFSLAPLLRDAAEKRTVTGEHFDGQWFDVGTPQRLHQLGQFLSK